MFPPPAAVILNCMHKCCPLSDSLYAVFPIIVLLSPLILPVDDVSGMLILWYIPYVGWWHILDKYTVLFPS
ncbi:MAG: hypothetical protein AMDU4_FER2C00111G0031 [Ferroplasma sp. Type II]|nr:MAG: hypothetical protein AMDU4_FER2C00111G0031 [Ferroplasma sp. Type II]